MKIHTQDGVSAIEFAFVLPILLIITFGIIEFGILLFDKAVITNASREGARSGIVFATDEDGAYLPMSNDDIRNVVMDYANDILINLGPAGMDTLVVADIVIEPENIEDRISDVDLTVTVTFKYDFLVLPDMTGLVGNSFKSAFDGTMDLIGQTVMRME